MDKSKALKVFGLSAEEPVLLGIGGSKGARSINNAILDNLPALLEKTQIIHSTGQLDWNEIQERVKNLPPSLTSKYHPYPFLQEDLAAAFSSADLCISRAGASTLGELPLFGLPAILVPYPYAWRYQKVNAAYLVDHGAAVMVKNEDLALDLLPTVNSLLQNRGLLADMSSRMHSLYQPEAASKIADLLLELAAKNTARKEKIR
jgi:UDP-N-acetylglucosamine--N-acetylmuramyl-(pentapeptide) pyrophosphoryl-undecaprenol N-acetylglucosamine transferase